MAGWSEIEGELVLWYVCVCEGGGGLQNQVVQLLNAYQTSRKERVLREEVGKDKNRDMTKTPHKTAREGEI